MRIFEVCFSVRNPDGSQNSNLDYLVTQVSALLPQQAEAMVEAQYAGNAKIWSCVER
ncbi:MAG: hypothetical protein ACKOD7_00900 [Polynucleobacter victoriensis]